MYLTSLTALGFRNLDGIEFFPTSGVNVVCGENGQGKTNLLEAIFMLTGARSFRGAKDSSVIMKGREFAVTSAQFFKENRDQHIRMTVSEKGRNASLNGCAEKKAATFAGTVCCVVFSPEHMQLVKGSPELRRRFIDTALFQLSPSYAVNLKNYVRLVTQRNKLLKDSSYIAAAYEMLDVYDAQFAHISCIVTKQRRDFVSVLLPLAQRAYESISGGREKIDFSYNSTMFGKEPEDYGFALDKLASVRTADLRAGFCTVGPHRDDLVITLDNSDSRVYASQGQQRSIVLSLKLAEAELMELELEERPILLFDDVLSELDDLRGDSLLRGIDDAQAIVTSCNPKSITEKTSAKVFRMSGGKLV